MYTASHIAEIVRGSIQAVPRGQGEAADALGLGGFQRLWYVVLPQAFRIAVPPIGNQYLNLIKNSSLGAAIGYYDLTLVTQTAVGNGAPAVPAFGLRHGHLHRHLAGHVRVRQHRQPPAGPGGAMSDAVASASRRRWSVPPTDAQAAVPAGAGSGCGATCSARRSTPSSRSCSGRSAVYVLYRALAFVFVTGRWEIIQVNLKLLMVGRYPTDAPAAHLGQSDRARRLGRRSWPASSAPARCGPPVPCPSAGRQRTRDLVDRLWIPVAVSLLLLALTTTPGPWLTASASSSPLSSGGCSAG